MKKRAKIIMNKGTFYTEELGYIWFDKNGNEESYELDNPNNLEDYIMIDYEIK